MDKELLFITVLGQDKKGIVARISGLLYESVSTSRTSARGSWKATS